MLGEPLCRQQRANLRCVSIQRGIPKLLPRHSFTLPPSASQVRARSLSLARALSLAMGSSLCRTSEKPCNNEERTAKAKN
jgi:hypothetical protein